MIKNDAAKAEAASTGTKKKSKGKKKDAVADELPLTRVDICEEAWDEGFRPPYLFGYWRTVIADANEKKRLLVGDQAIMELLISLADETDDKKLAFRYVLALILMRKKLLRHNGIDRREDSDGDGPVQDWWKFTPKVDVTKGHFGKWDNDVALEVLDPHIDASQIAGVTDQLSQILDLGL